MNKRSFFLLEVPALKFVSGSSSFQSAWSLWGAAGGATTLLLRATLISMSPTCMELAEDMKEKCNVDIDTRFFEWSQHTAVESRHEDQGSSCCGLFAALTIQSWAESDKRATMFQNWHSADYWRPLVQSAVQKWDKAISTDP